MSCPGEVVTRVLRFGLRFSLSRSFRTCSSFQTVLSNRSVGVYSQRSAYAIHNISANNFVRRDQVRAMSALSSNDPSSYSKPDVMIIKHVSLSLNVNFDKKVLKGSALLKLEAFKDTKEVILDVNNQTIDSVELDNGTTLKFQVDGHVPNLGSRLVITLPHTVSPSDNVTDKSLLGIGVLKSEVTYFDKEESNVTVKTTSFMDCLYHPLRKVEATTGADTDDEEEGIRTIRDPVTCACDQQLGNALYEPLEYSPSDKAILAKLVKDAYSTRFQIKINFTTAPTASALQWLEPSQTSGKKYPYMFSQCQPIHARSILPCQDTPAVKFTYDAEVSAPEEFTVLMSALRKEKIGTTAKFEQPTPIPSYLLAIAVGVLEFRELGPRSKVWSEKEEVERSAWEFADTEKYLQAAEKLCGPYQWNQYDLLVLPPSFPYGGMENPCLTFVTPTLLAGDRSQADVIVHEIMHSWTGNLVTNKNFEHFWLNEGFTVFLERKVAASLISDPDEAQRSRDFHSLLGLQELNEAVNVELGPNNPLTKLVVDLKTVHPDDAFSTVPYEKGSLFLRYLEELLDGADRKEVFDDFLRSYLNKFQRKSLDTDQFKAHLLSYFNDSFAQERLAKVDWNAWLYTPGMPPIIPQFDTSMTKAVNALLAKIADDKHTIVHDDVKHITPHQIINLLQELIERPPLSVEKLETIGKEYKIADSKNSEIRYRWLRLCAKSKNSQRLPEIFEFINTQGRMKFVRPLYRDLYGWEEMRKQAIENFLKNESKMMHVSAYTVRKDLHLNGE